MEQRSRRHGIKTPIAPPSLPPSLLLTHYTRSFSIYTNYRFLQPIIAQTKAVKSFEKWRLQRRRQFCSWRRRRRWWWGWWYSPQILTKCEPLFLLFLAQGSSFFCTYRWINRFARCKKHASSWSCSLLFFSFHQV